MQNRDGGWGAFDKDNDSRVPLPRAVRRSQRDDRSQHARPDRPACSKPWPCGAQQPDEPAIQRGRRLPPPHARARRQLVRPLGRQLYLRHLAGPRRPGGRRRSQPTIQLIDAAPTGCSRHQQACGGWGESADSYEQPELRGQGPCTAVANRLGPARPDRRRPGDQPQGQSHRGIRYLLDTQHPDGTWDEPEFTGTGFPRVFYLRYHYYPIYFPAVGPDDVSDTNAEVQSSECRISTACTYVELCNSEL